MGRARLLLTKRQIEKGLKKLPEWSVDAKQSKLKATFSFETHVEALLFVVRISVHAQVLRTFPDIRFVNEKVYVTVPASGEGGLGARDFAFALRIDALAHTPRQ